MPWPGLWTSGGSVWTPYLCETCVRAVSCVECRCVQNLLCATCMAWRWVFLHVYCFSFVACVYCSISFGSYYVTVHIYYITTVLLIFKFTRYSSEFRIVSTCLSNTRIVLVGDHCSFVKRYMSATSSLWMYSSTAIPLQEKYGTQSPS